MSEADFNSRAGSAASAGGSAASATLGSASQSGSATQSGGGSLGINFDSEVARLAVESGLASPQEVARCRDQQKQASDPNQRSLADLLVENSFMTASQVRRIKSQLETGDNSQIPGYQLISRLGKGAMATVYKARQASLDRIVAIKALPKKMSESAEFVDRFYKEGKAAARLSHNNIVQAIAVGFSPKGYHYFVMECIEGKTLYDIMAPPPHGDGHQFSEAEALDIIGQIADALAHSHLRGLIHRDVKPKNIIMTPQGVAKLTDMGLARAQDDKEAAESEAGKAYGTPYYISPEQIRGDVDIDSRADIYSLGATMYHLVTGRPPFEADTPAAVMHKHLKSPLVPADHLNTALSSGVGEIIETAMAKRREDRYASAADMLADLRAVQAGRQPEFARRIASSDELAQLEATGKTVDISPPPAPPPSIWSQPVMWVVTGIGAASVLANVVLLILLLRQPPKPATVSNTPADLVVAVPVPLPASATPTPATAETDDEAVDADVGNEKAKEEKPGKEKASSKKSPASPKKGGNNAKSADKDESAGASEKSATGSKAGQPETAAEKPPVAATTRPAGGATNISPFVTPGRDSGPATKAPNTPPVSPTVLNPNVAPATQRTTSSPVAPSNPGTGVAPNTPPPHINVTPGGVLPGNPAELTLPPPPADAAGNKNVAPGNKNVATGGKPVAEPEKPATAPVKKKGAGKNKKKKQN